MSYCTPEEAAQLDSSLVAKDDITPEMLQWADGQVDQYTGRTYVQEVQVTDEVDGEGTPTVQLPHRPVTSVISVLVNDTAQPASTWVFYPDGRLSLQPLPEEFDVGDAVWPVGKQNIAVTYKYGTVDGVRLPADVQFAAAQVTAIIAKYAKMGLLGPGAEDWKVGDVSIKMKANAQLGVAIRETLEATLGGRPPLIV